ncbi:hypothetical protein VTK73DRAFT_3192 [Phialemonium thermophilum]|uniref:Uncharacterized protein n=1 Tax=Phialemonium thermophilum TaxID=223376 RepID=A0ABR3VKX6_9PEZI
MMRSDIGPQHGPGMRSVVRGALVHMAAILPRGTGGTGPPWLRAPVRRYQPYQDGRLALGQAVEQAPLPLPALPGMFTCFSTEQTDLHLLEMACECMPLPALRQRTQTHRLPLPAWTGTLRMPIVPRCSLQSARTGDLGYVEWSAGSFGPPDCKSGGDGRVSYNWGKDSVRVNRGDSAVSLGHGHPSVTLIDANRSCRYMAWAGRPVWGLGSNKTTPCVPYTTSTGLPTLSAPRRTASRQRSDPRQR